MRYVPNVLTGLRLFGALCLLFLEPLALPFYVVYSICGMSDALDGFLARKYHVASQAGALLDSISDLVFYGVTLWLVLGNLIKDMSLFQWIWLVVILLIRLIIYVEVAFRYHRFDAIHTYANKACGFLLFLLPYMLHVSFRKYYFFLGLSVACIAALEEVVIYWMKQEYDPNCRTIFFILRDKKRVSAETE